jgi:hypothetical protein
MSKVLRDNGLSLALLVLFLISLAGQSIAGLAHFNEDRSEHGQPAAGYIEYIRSAAFAESVFENWESEFLQMGLYVALTSLLFQRGSAESKNPDEPEEVDEDPAAHASDPEAPYPVRAGGVLLKLYQYSLSLSLMLLFLVSFVLHLVSSARENCREQELHGQTCTTLTAYLGGATFWFESFQNWQSEFLSIFVVVVLSIFLRHKGSSESKPVHASHKKTGR